MSAVTVTAEDDVRGMARLQKIEHDRGVGQHHGVTARNSMRNAIHICAVGGRIVEADDT